MKTILASISIAAAAVVFGTAVADPYPEGCVSCHVQTEAADLRLSTLLEMKGHARGANRTVEVPTGCNRCHAPDNQGVAPSTRNLVHSIHFEYPLENTFVTQYGGECTHCHVMDGSTGNVAIKTGKRNWEYTIGQ